MRKLWVLLKLNFKVMLVAFSFGRGRKKAASGIGALLLMAFLALYLSGVYSFVMAETLGTIGRLDLLLPMMAVMASLMSLVFTLFAASGLVFGGKDSDIVMALPVPAFTVMLSKLLALYLENLVFCGMWMLPTVVIYQGYGGSGGVLFILLSVIAILFLPFLPTLIALFGGWLVAYFSSRMKHKTLVGNLLSFLLIGAVLLGSFQINGMMGALLTNADTVNRVFHTGLLPFGLMMDGVQGDFLALLGFLACCLLPFLLLVWIFSKQYKKILSGLSSHVSRNDYKLHGVKSNGQFAALFKKECGRYFSSNIYLFNTGVGAIMLVGASVYALIAQDQARLLLAQLGGSAAAIPILAVAVCGIEAIMNTACVSLSLEGKTLWILKGAPIPTQVLFGAKALLNILLCAVSCVLSIVLLTIALGLPVGEAAVVLLLGIVWGVFIAFAGLALNLKFPKMDCDNDTIIVKQSASVFCADFGGFALVGIGALLYSMLGPVVGVIPFLLLCTVLLAGLSYVLWRYLNGKGAQVLLGL